MAILRGGVLRVAIRDDDTNFFTRPEQLERVYGRYWDRIPISLAVVPVHASTRSGAIPRRHWEGEREFPLAGSSELVDFLRRGARAGRVSIMLHGYSHRDYPDGPEFVAAPRPAERLARGRGYLEALFGRPIRTFVPPHNALSRRGLRAVDAAGLNVLGSFYSFRPDKKPWGPDTARNYLLIRAHRRRTGRSRRERLLYPWPLRYKSHAEFGCQPLVPRTTWEELLDRFEEARRLGGDFCLATHYWEIDGRLADILDRLIDHADRAGVRWVHADELFDQESGTRSQELEGVDDAPVS
jgi:peptidoglycan/xylan/chitin deacetylase (PgdA/CDA1 family)